MTRDWDRPPRLASLDHELATETARAKWRTSNLARCYLDLVEEVARLRSAAEGDQVLDLRPEVLRRLEPSPFAGLARDLEFGRRKRRPEP
jgi:hypothetical protein